MFRNGAVISESILKIRIGIGESIAKSHKQYNVNALVTHEDYSQKTFEHDIALVKLKETLSLTDEFRAICYSQLANLPKVPPFGTAIGYGSTVKSVSYSDVLRQAEMPIVENEECLDTDQEYYNKHLFSGNFCAGELGKESGVCSGDSGENILSFYLARL